jgi:hypothetical protein
MTGDAGSLRREPGAAHPAGQREQDCKFFSVKYLDFLKIYPSSTVEERICHYGMGYECKTFQLD